VRRRRRSLAAENAALREQLQLLQTNETRHLIQLAAQRIAIADLGRQLHGTQAGPLGDTVPMRVRSHAPASEWPPEAWRPR